MRAALLVLTAATVACVFGVLPAAAHPDGPSAAFIEHQARLTSLRWPAEGSVTDGFGLRWGRLHAGIDIGILRSLAVRAAASGTVTAVGELPGYEGYGTIVLIDIGDDYEALYAHLARADVRRGEWVSAGERLGLAGCTGSCTGTHLHFEVHHRGVPTDPMQFLSLRALS